MTGPGPAQVRAATQADAAAIAEIHTRGWQVAYAGRFPAEYLASRRVDEATDRWLAWLEPGRESATTALVVDVRGTVTGIAACGPTRDTDAKSVGRGELMMIYVAPSSLRRGAGTALIRAVRAQLVADGFTRATLWVLDGNEPAESLYRKDDWARDGATKVDDSLGFAVPEVRYARTLP